MSWFRRVTPRGLRRAVKRLLYKKYKKTIDWEYMPQGWAARSADPDIKGWNVETIRETYAKKLPAFLTALEEPKPLGFGHEFQSFTEEDLAFHNMNMSYGYVLALAARCKPSLSLLDWGGGIGHFYALSQALVPDLRLDYHCKDVPVLAEFGKTVLPNAHFYSDDRCFERTYDLVVASSSLHYSEDWPDVLRKLAGATREYLYVCRLPVVREADSFVFVQRPYAMGYGTEYLSWCLNRGEFLAAAEALGLRLVREFISGETPYIDRAPEQNQYRGFLFHNRAARKSADSFAAVAAPAREFQPQAGVPGAGG